MKKKIVETNALINSLKTNRGGTFQHNFSPEFSCKSILSDIKKSVDEGTGYIGEPINPVKVSNPNWAGFYKYPEK